MHLLPVSLPLIGPNDNLTDCIADYADIREGDIVAVSSKVIAAAENAYIDLSTLTITQKAQDLANTYRSAAFCQAVLNETERLASLRIGIGRFTTEEELVRAADQIINAVENQKVRL